MQHFTIINSLQRKKICDSNSKFPGLRLLLGVHLPGLFRVLPRPRRDDRLVGIGQGGEPVHVRLELGRQLEPDFEAGHGAGIADHGKVKVTLCTWKQYSTMENIHRSFVKLGCVFKSYTKFEIQNRVFQNINILLERTKKDPTYMIMYGTAWPQTEHCPFFLLSPHPPCSPNLQAKQLFRSPPPPPPPFPQSAPFFPSPERTEPRSPPCFSGSVRREHNLLWASSSSGVYSIGGGIRQPYAGKQERFIQGKKRNKVWDPPIVRFFKKLN